MANANRGEVALSLDGATYTLVFSVNALCDLETKLGKPINEILASLSDSGLKTLRTLLQCGLSQHHPQISETMAGDMLSFGNTAIVMGKIGEALSLAFPPPVEGEAKSDEARPT